MSVLIPTKHRPDFVSKIIWSLREQSTQHGFELIISDNFQDPRKKVESDSITDLDWANVFTPPQYLSMVDNWNFLLSKAKGEYIMFFTDKMILLPGMISFVEQELNREPVDILNWVDEKWLPKSYADYFGPGWLVKADISTSGQFDPLEELQIKALGKNRRRTQTPSQYARGKVCFGVYSRSLIERICASAGKLFHDISPDYTSMILGLSHAKSAAEIKTPGVIHINTDISNGGLCDTNPQHALDFFQELEHGDQMITSMPTPGLYASTHNSILSDYMRMKDLYALDYEIGMENWFVEIGYDLFRDEMNWRSEEEKTEQQGLYIEKLREWWPDEYGNIMQKVEQLRPPTRHVLVESYLAIKKRFREWLLGPSLPPGSIKHRSIESAWKTFI